MTPARMRPRAAAVAIAGMLALAFVATAAVPARAADNIVLQLSWKHQAEYAGYYVARDKGWYADENLTVDIRAATPTDNLPSLIEDGEVDVIVWLMASALNAREAGAPLVNIAQVFQDEGWSLVCRRDAGIRVLDHLRGKKIGHWIGEGSTGALHALLAGLGITPKSKLELATFDPKTDARLIEFANPDYGLKTGLVDCIPWFAAKGLDELDFRAGELVEFPYRTLGVGLLGNGLWAHQERLQDPAFREVMARFVRASMRGWHWARDNQAAAVDIVLQNMGATDAEAAGGMRAAQIAQLRGMLELLGDGGGALDARDYRRSVDILLAGGVLDAAPTGAWTSDITDRARLYADDRFDRWTESVARWAKDFWLALLDPRSTLSHLGWALIVVSMLMTNIVWVRVLVVSSTMTFFFNDLLLRFDYASLTWTLLIALASLYTALKDKITDRFMRFTPDEEAMLRICFPNMARGRARYLLNQGQWRRAERDTFILRSGKMASHVHFVLEGEGVCVLDGRTLGKINPPMFIGHLAFDKMLPSIWGVQVRADTRYWSIEAAKLRNLLENRPEIGVELQRNFAQSNRNYISIILSQLNREQTAGAA